TNVAQQVGDYLLRGGHKTVLFLNASSDMSVSYDRKHGLAEAYSQHGLPMPEEYVVYYDHKLHANGTEYGYMSIMNTNGNMNYTAVITDTDRVALGVLRAARELDIEVPEQLSVIALSNDAILAQDM
ncbi:LacI family transcriptional regulator, partial [Clostridium perfringens]